MFMTPAKLLFTSTLLLGSIISITSTSWLGVWMGLEINLLSFIPLMTDTKNILTTEASLKYFLIQALGSTMLLFSVVLSYVFINLPLYSGFDLFNTLICSALFLKMGAAPFHFWFPGTMEGLSWSNCIILMTWQKVAPLMLLSYVVTMNIFTSTIIIASVLIGSIGGLNQTSLRKLMAYSSINHLGWMVAALMAGENMWELYFMIYTFLSLSIVLLFNLHHTHHINQNLLTMSHSPLTSAGVFLLFLSLGGLPPFMGFIPKWLIIQALTDMSLQFTVIIMVVTTLLTLFYYLRLTFLAFLFTYTEMKLPLPTPYDKSSLTILFALVGVSTLGLPLCAVIHLML